MPVSPRDDAHARPGQTGPRSEPRGPATASQPESIITRVDIPGRVYVKAVFTILLTLFLIGFFKQIALAGIMLALALIVAAVLDPAVNWLQEHRLSRGLASMLALLLLVLIVLGLLLLVVPTLITQGVELAQDLPNLLLRLRRAVAEYPAVYRALERQSVSIQQDPARFFSGFLRVGVNVLSGIISGVLTLTLALYLLIDKERLLKSVLIHTPHLYRDRVERTITECAAVVRAYFAGQAIVSTMFAVFAFIVLLVLGVPYAGILAAFAFFLDAIPNIGATLATVVTALTALLMKSPTSALIVVVAFEIYQVVENNFISPRILGGRLNIPAVLTLIAILIGGQVLGVLGVILAIPLAGMLPVIDRIWFIGSGQSLPPLEADKLPQAAD